MRVHRLLLIIIIIIINFLYFLSYIPSTSRNDTAAALRELGLAPQDHPLVILLSAVLNRKTVDENVMYVERSLGM